MEPAKLNQGIFTFFIKNGLDHSEMHRILKFYAKEHLDRTLPTRRHLKWYASISEKAGEDFENFKKCFNKHKRRNRRRAQTYDEWFVESSLDGTFAYNGSADDL